MPSSRPVSSSLLLLVLAAASASAGVLNVPGDHSSVTGALAAAGPGDSVLVDPGIYSSAATGETFPLSVSPGVSLLGSGMAVSVVDADSAGSVVVMTGGRVNGFTLTRGAAPDGGGVHVLAGSPEIDGNLIVANWARDRGAGIHVAAGASPWIHHNVVWESKDTSLEQPGDPHGVQLADADAVVEHNLIGRTESNGLFFNGTSNPEIRNNIFFENGIPGLRGRGICALADTTATIVHNLFFANEIAAILVSTAEGVVDQTAEEANDLDAGDGVYGNLDGDPRFTDADAMDWSLLSVSPAIDAGDPASPPDPDATPADIGPFHFDQAASGVPGGPPVPGLRAFPNPFTASITIHPGAPSELSVVDVRGRLVRGLGRAVSPEIPVRWDGRDGNGRPAASGVYFLVSRTAAGSNALPVLKLR